MLNKIKLSYTINQPFYYICETPEYGYNENKS